MNKQTITPKPLTNQGVSAAKKAKQDEFYTQLDDISKELKHYKSQLYGKTILCNCDDPYERNFFRYFALNFNSLGLKKLITTSFGKSSIAGGYLPLLDIEGLKPEGKEPYAIEINEVPDQNGDGAIDLGDVEQLLREDANVSRTLSGGPDFGAGDFRSKECIEYLEQADVVVTNPPFSLFKEYIAQLIEHDKKFLIIGNVNAVDYRGIFGFIKNNKIWLGESIHSGDREFRVPEHYPLEAAGFRVDESGAKYIRVKGVRWFTNMDVPIRHQKIPLFKKYSPEEYPTYENYDAIEVGKVADIPVDYDGLMGVPITFLDKYNPNQFEICGMCENKDIFGLKTRMYSTQECRDAYLRHFGKPGTYDLNAAAVIEGRKVYKRLLIRRR